MRALGATTFGSTDSGLNRAGIMSNEAMPGTNMHAAEGKVQLAMIVFSTKDFCRSEKVFASRIKFP